MATKELPSPEVLRQLLRYEPETGKLFWKERGAEWFSDGYRKAAGNCAVWNARYADSMAFTAVGSHGYFCGAIFDVKWLAHRVIWALVNGCWPLAEIDHVDGNPLNNRIENLRAATSAQNSANTKEHKDSASGMKGVSPHQGRWRARIGFDRKKHSLGVFDTREQARAAYRIAAIKAYGEYAK